jgi:UPF0755 protein
MRLVVKVCSVLFIFAAPLILWTLFNARSTTGVTFQVTEKSTLVGTLSRLEEQGIVRSPLLTRALVALFGNSNLIKQGEYTSSVPLSDFALARMLASGKTSANYIKVTIPEGLTVLEIASILHSKIPNFNTPQFIAKALPHEGFLFPDTYYFLPVAKADTVISVMRSTLTKKLEPYDAEIVRSGRTLKEIIIMASLLEEEARTTESRKMISGILWKRLDIGMPLQVDAVFPYIIGKNTYEVSLTDLAFDSPYNTYKYKGLPRGPITNPSLDSILAALRPTSSNYLYYLSNLSGKMYYAVTFDQHVENKRLYLKQK